MDRTQLRIFSPLTWRKIHVVAVFIVDDFEEFGRNRHATDQRLFSNNYLSCMEGYDPYNNGVQPNNEILHFF